MYVDDMSFILGLFVSDGNLDKSRVRFFCSEEEIIFFQNVVSPMIEKLFKVKPTIRHDIKRNYVLSINSSKIEKVFRNIFPYKGEKCKHLKEPRITIDEQSFIAGLVSGDGSIIISKNNSTVNKYPILAYVNASKTIISIFSRFLIKNGISHYVHQNRNKIYHITVKGNGLRHFLELVPLLNHTQKSKIEVFKKLGYLKPYSTYKERLEILNMRR
jgi:predicted transcriptional regulator